MTRSKTVRTMMLALGATLLAAGMPVRAQAQTVSATLPDRIGERFLQSLRYGKALDALTELARTSPLMAKKQGDLQALAAQIDGAITNYGPIKAWERIGSEALGTMVRRDTYLVQHRDAVLRWRFIYARAGSGWTISQFDFEDEAQGWFK
ncbi:MAG: hypothetical protein V4574_07370 [Pseudomonadota bacterium]